MAKASNGVYKSQKEELPASVPESIGANVEHEAVKDGEYDESKREDDTSLKSHDESESFSDIDDREVDVYLNNEEEKHYKKIIWEKLNRKYLEEQAAKEAVAVVAKSRKRRAHETKNSEPSQSAAEATCQMFRTKRLSSKVNYERLAQLLDEHEDDSYNPKKVRFELPSDNFDNLQSKLEDKKDGELGSADELGDESDIGGIYGNNLYAENLDETYDHEDDGCSYYDDDY